MPLSFQFLKLKRFVILGRKFAKMLAFGNANCGAPVHLPQNGSFCVQLVRGNGDFPARQLQVDFGAQMCRIVDRALTRS